MTQFLMYEPGQRDIPSDVLQACVLAIQRARSVSAEMIGKDLDDLVADASGKLGTFDEDLEKTMLLWDDKAKAGGVSPVEAMNAILWLKMRGSGPILAELMIVLTARGYEKYVEEPTKILEEVV